MTNEKDQKREVVVIDDEPFIHELVDECIGGHYKVIHYIRSPQGLTALLERMQSGKKTHAVLLDNKMPEMTGTELLAQLDQYPIARRIPIVGIGSFMDGEINGINRTILPKNTLTLTLYDLLEKIRDYSIQS